MSNIPATFIGKVKTIYKKKGYLDRYGGSVIIAGILLFITWLILSYFVVMHQIKPIKADWVNRRCNPNVMPFAGIINGPPGQSKFSFTGQNFTNCVSIVLKQILGDILKPIYAIEHLITDAINELHKIIQDIRRAFQSIRISIENMVKRILNRLLNTVTPMVFLMAKMKDIMEKTGGILTQVLMMMLGLWYTVKASIGAFIELLIFVIIILVVMIAVFWIDPFSWFLALIATAIFLFLAIMCAIIIYWMNKILDLTGQPADPTTSCFDKDTQINTCEGIKFIHELIPGEILADGSVVTAVFKLSRENEDMYNYENVIVSGSHQIITPLEKCLSVSSHPNSRHISDYNKPYLYCLSTSSKVININGITFSDWDEVDNNDWVNIQERAAAYLPDISRKEHIHTHLESGFDGCTDVLLLDGTKKYMKNINIGDYLENGEKVLGIVKILGDDVVIKRYNIKGKCIVCSTNVPFVNDNLGNMTTKKLRGERVFLEDQLYHIITDTKFLTIKGVKFHDYNGVIEKIMEGPQFLFPTF